MLDINEQKWEERTRGEGGKGGGEKHWPLLRKCCFFSPGGQYETIYKHLLARGLQSVFLSFVFNFLGTKVSWICTTSNTSGWQGKLLCSYRMVYGALSWISSYIPRLVHDLGCSEMNVGNRSGFPLCKLPVWFGLEYERWGFPFTLLPG